MFGVLNSRIMGLFGNKEGRTASEWFHLGYDAKDPEKAVEYYTKALEIDPKYIYAWYNKGIALYNLGRYEEAVKCFDKELERHLKDAHGWYGKGITLYELGRYGELTCDLKRCTACVHSLGKSRSRNESRGEKVSYLFTAIIQPYKERNVIQIALWAYSDKPHGLRGFLSEITHSIRQHVEPMPHVHEVKIVERYIDFRLIRDFEKYCNSRYVESEILIDKLEVVYHSLKAAEPITKEEILPLVEDNLNAMRVMKGGVEAQKERGMRMCEKLVELLHAAHSNV